MTHRDIYTKFMIEYDKAQVTSSYPSLTEYEVATVLDKAYNALIAQKVTGNNYRRVPFEADIKAISDLQPLVTSYTWGRPFSDNAVIKNQLDFILPGKTAQEGEFLYYVGCRLEGHLYKQSIPVTDAIKPTSYDDILPVKYFSYSGVRPSYVFIVPISFIPADKQVYFSGSEADTWYVGDYKTELNDTETQSVISNLTAYGQVFKFDETTGTTTNEVEKTALQNAIDSTGSLHDTIIMWPNTDVRESDRIYTSRSKTRWDKDFPYDRELYRTLPCQIVDYNTAQKFFTSAYNMPWIKNPVCYIHGDVLHVVKEDDDISNYVTEKCVLTYIKKPASFVKHLVQGEQNKNFFDQTKFELNETMAEELISLGIAMALENIESPRLNSKLNMRGLEA